jgi:hypothetical protein
VREHGAGWQFVEVWSVGPFETGQPDVHERRVEAHALSMNSEWMRRLEDIAVRVLLLVAVAAAAA